MKNSLHNLISKFIARASMALGAMLFALGLSAQSQIFNSNGTFVVPSGVTSVTVQAWGGGGGAGSWNDRCGGGGGGAYASSTVAVMPGQMISVVVGAGGGLEQNGGSSSFGAFVIALGGQGANNQSGGNGGSAAGSTGTTKYSGGDGGNGRNNGGGGGGGGSAFADGNGQDGDDGDTFFGGNGGSGTGDGGNGGNEFGGGSSGQSGQAPGGGGGGHGDDSGSSAAGAAGRVVVSYCVSGPVTLPYNEGFETVGPTLGFTSDQANINGLCNWAYDETSGSSGRLRFDVVSHNGSRAALMDKSSAGGGNQTNYLISTIDLGNYACATDLALSFWHVQYDDESNSDDRVWVRGSSADAWIQIHDLTSSQGSDGNWVHVTGLDIDDVLANAVPAQTPSATFQIRFGQEDNFDYNDDGRAFDDIQITGTVGNGCCTDPVFDMVQATVNPVCVGEETMLAVTGNLGDATEWHWYSVGGTPVGTGATITVSLSDTMTFYVRGEGGCVTPETQSNNGIFVDVYQLPIVYNVGGGGAYCDGGSGFPITLSGSQIGVNYLLQRDGGNVGGTVPGTGSPLNFGIQAAAGNYTVLATNATTNCTATMNGSADITIKPNPVCTISDGMAAVCPNSTNNQYSAPAGMDQYGWGISGDGNIVGSVTGSSISVTAGASGSYTVTVTITKNGCSSTCNKEVDIAVQPFQLVYATEYCKDEPGPMIGLNGSENGAMYQLQTGGGVNVGAPVVGTGAPINFGAFPNGPYKVSITGGICDVVLPLTIDGSEVDCAIDVPDFCACNAAGGYAPVTIKIAAPAVQNWEILEVTGLYGADPYPQITPGTLLNYIGNEMYTLDAFRDNTKGYFIKVSNGYTERQIQVGTPSW